MLTSKMHAIWNPRHFIIVIYTKAKGTNPRQFEKRHPTLSTSSQNTSLLLGPPYADVEGVLVDEVEDTEVPDLDPVVAGEVAPPGLHACLVACQRQLHGPRSPARVLEYHQPLRRDAIHDAELLPDVLHEAQAKTNTISSCCSECCKELPSWRRKGGCRCSQTP
uniref:Uncharacterized protein n=1 Tax=Hordeum vulgare subsp. vulgare TaxID=112509 RepID=A0A8I6Y5N2_HORVV